MLATIPQPYRALAIKHRELVKFAVVGGTTWVIDTVVFLVLKSTVLEPKPITAKIIAVLGGDDRVVHPQPRVELPHPWWP